MCGRRGDSRLKIGAVGQALAEGAHFGGYRYDLRKKLGSEDVLDNREGGYRRPETFLLSEQEFRDFIAQKDVYAVLYSFYKVRFMQDQVLSRLKETTQQILTALESLD